jgi:hypothetical protein
MHWTKIISKLSVHFEANTHIDHDEYWQYNSGNKNRAIWSCFAEHG